MAVKENKTLLESTPIDEVLLVKMREIYAEYTGLQIAAVIAQIRKEINERDQMALLEYEIQRRQAELHKLKS